MRDDVPAALPLIAFVAALACAPIVVNPKFTIAGLLIIAALLRRPRIASVLGCTMCGLLVGLQNETRQSAERAAFRAIPPSRFSVIEAPIEHDWSRRPHVFVLRSSRFIANGVTFDSPLSIYVRFPPPSIALEKTVRIEGFLRLDDRGRYTVSVKSARLLTYRGRVSRLSPATWNRMIAQRLEPYAEQRPAEIAMIEALALGRGERLSETTREDYRRGGTYHLLVFSGLQIGLAAALIALLLRWSGYARVSDWCLLFFAIVAPLFIGPTASVSRASCGIALYALSRIAGRPTSFENLWCVSAILRLAIEPRDLADPAFHLTYAGAGALIFIGKPMARSQLRWLAYAVAAELAVVPLTLFHFQQYALGGSLSTVALTPLVFIQLIVGSAFAAVRAPVLLDVVGGISATSAVVNRGASPASGFFAAPPLLALVAAVFIVLLAIALMRGHRRLFVILTALLIADASAIARHVIASDAGAARVTFLDVGQGDAILIRSGKRSALIDGGGRSDDTRFGHTVLLPLLVNRGIRRLDFVALSHAHPDHCGGLPAVLRELHVGQLRVSPQRFRGHCAQMLLEAARDAEVPVVPVLKNEEVRLGVFELTLTPPARRYRRAPENNSSMIVRARTSGRSVLLTGDIEREAELDLAASVAPADVLKIPHHGSRTSTTRPLLRAVQPRIAVITCGRNNLFGHPHRNTIDALTNGRARMWRTDRNGTIDIVIQRTISVVPQIDTPVSCCLQ